MTRRFDHIDLRVPEIALVASFYDALSALGFTRRVPVEGWLQFESGEGDVTEFLGVTDPLNTSRTKIAFVFWAENVAVFQSAILIGRAKMS
ncbi:MAG: hypothetical protein ACXW3Z_03990 [Limisphaerales bacterium]